MHLYIRNLEEKKEIWDVYLQPFEEDLWFAILYWILLSGFIIFLISFITSKISSLKSRYSLLDQGFIPLSAFCYQST